MDVTPQELRGSEIKEAWRGYHRDEVDDLLERAAVTIESLSQQLATAGARPAAEPGAVQVNRDDAEMLQRTLLLAQRAADDAVNDAQAQARKLIEESEARAQTLVSEAEATARRIAESERRRLESEVQELAARRDALRADADALEEYASAYRDRLRSAIEADLDRLGTGAVDAPTARPELHDVEVPPAPRPAERAPEPPPEHHREPDVAPAPGESFGADTRAITIDAPTAASLSSDPSPSPIASPPRPSEPEWPPPAAAPDARASSGQGPAGAWLAGNDDWSATDTALDDGLPWEQATAQHEPFASDVPMEATPIEHDALDDDAFFASLRDAVRDDESLGPRDDEQPTAFFDDELAEDRRRFRRRR
jgi:DivIVA domain-containing protein